MPQAVPAQRPEEHILGYLSALDADWNPVWAVHCHRCELGWDGKSDADHDVEAFREQEPPPEDPPYRS